MTTTITPNGGLCICGSRQCVDPVNPFSLVEKSVLRGIRDRYEASGDAPNALLTQRALQGEHMPALWARRTLRVIMGDA